MTHPWRNLPTPPEIEIYVQPSLSQKSQGGWFATSVYKCTIYTIFSWKRLSCLAAHIFLFPGAASGSVIWSLKASLNGAKLPEETNTQMEAVGTCGRFFDVAGLEAPSRKSQDAIRIVSAKWVVVVEDAKGHLFRVGFITGSWHFYQLDLKKPKWVVYFWRKGQGILGMSKKSCPIVDSTYPILFESSTSSTSLTGKDPPRLRQTRLLQLFFKESRHLLVPKCRRGNWITSESNHSRILTLDNCTTIATRSFTALIFFHVFFFPVQPPWGLQFSTKKTQKRQGKKKKHQQASTCSARLLRRVTKSTTAKGRKDANIAMGIFCSSNQGSNLPRGRPRCHGE